MSKIEHSYLKSDISVENQTLVFEIGRPCRAIESKIGHYVQKH